MAEGYLAKRLHELGMDTTVISAGTGAMPGLKPTEETTQVMNEVGVDVSGYVSSTLKKEYIDSADVILVMSPHHKETVLNLSPDARWKIHYLKEFSPEKNKRNNWIEDPIGRPVEFYRKIFESIKGSIEGFLKWEQEQE
jgi:protein-tyrosine phosphatase